MVDVRQVLPVDDGVESAALVEHLAAAQHVLQPFDDLVIEFIADLSRALRRHPRVAGSPALGALAYWIRPASVNRLHEDWKRLVDLDPQVVRVPRGVVFHVPPTNVDTLFVYSWLLSALCGNANIIRLSSSAIEGAPALLDAVGSVLDDHSTVAATTSIVTYGHERDISESLSSSDVRVVWGGDATVAAFSQIPTSPRTREISFPDRYSLCLLDGSAVTEADNERIDTLAHRFFNDAYWFDQLGCASPRLVVWLGDVQSVRTARSRFWKALRRRINDGQLAATPTSAAIAKLVHATDMAACGVVERIEWSDNSLTIAELDGLSGLQRDSPGGGLFYEVQVGDLDEVAPFIRKKDQTATAFGIAAPVLRRFVTSVGARGIDRVVPVGDALTFGRFWDGLDLLAEFSSAVIVSE